MQKAINSINKNEAMKDLVKQVFAIKETPSSQDQLENLLHKLIRSIEPFIEQPNLLDPELHDLTFPFVEHLKTKIDAHYKEIVNKRRLEDVSLTDFDQACFKWLYEVLRISKNKTYELLLTHEAEDMEPVFFYIKTIKRNTKLATYEVRNVLNSWFLGILLTPFDINKVIDTGISVELYKKGLLLNIYETYKENLIGCSDGTKMISMVLAKLMVRKEANDYLLKEEFTKEIMKSNIEWPALSTIYYITKYIDSRNLNSEITNNIYQILHNVQNEQGSWSMKRLLIKTMSNLIIYHIKLDVQVAKKFDLENGINTIVTGIEDKNTNIRWTSAKKLRDLCLSFTETSNSHIVNEIIHNILKETKYDTKSRVDEFLWHGTLLALAEIVRKDLYDDQILACIVEFALKGLKINIKRGTQRIGANIRDSSCYVLWSVSRSKKAKSLMKMPNLKSKIQEALVVTSLFDMEIQVRRAASATYQEFVGRMQLFDSGLEIVPIIDFINVGNINNTYIRYCVLIYKYPSYKKAIKNYLLEYSIFHFDQNISRLSAFCLEILASRYPMDFVDVIDGILKDSSSLSILDVEANYSLYLCICSIFVGIKKSKTKLTECLENKVYQFISSNVSCKLRGAKKIHEMYVHIIRSLSYMELKSTISIDKNIYDNIKFCLHKTKDEKNYMNKICEDVSSDLLKEYRCFYEETTNIYYVINRLSSIYTFKAYSRFVFNENVPAEELHPLIFSLGFVEYSSNTDAVHPAVEHLIETHKNSSKLKKNVSSLIKNSTMCALACIMKQQIINENAILSCTLLEKIKMIFVNGLDDYALDKQLGDIGSINRKASLCCIKVLISYLSIFSKTSGIFEIKIEDISQIYSKTLKMTLERNDAIRNSAYELMKILHDRFEYLIKAETDSKILSLDQINDNEKFLEYSVNLATHEKYKDDIMTGIALVFGKSHSTIKQKVIQAIKKTSLEKNSYRNMFFENFVDIFVKNQQPFLNRHLIYASAALIDAEILDVEENIPTTDIWIRTMSTKTNTNDFGTLDAISKFTTSLLFINKSISESSFEIVIELLQHKYIQIRSITAEYLYSALDTNEQTTLELDQLMEKMQDVDWSNTPEVLDFIAILKKSMNR